MRPMITHDSCHELNDEVLFHTSIDSAGPDESLGNIHHMEAIEIFTFYERAHICV